MSNAARDDNVVSVPSDSLWSRLLFTPLSDLLRGRLTARLDVRRVIAAADLPGPLAGLVYDVARRTRLWRIEKADVARELAAHFRDGLDTGVPPEKLLQDFGEPRQAARLIRRAKLRARPWPWQVWRWGLRATGFLLAAAAVIYLGLAVRFWVGRPSVTRDFVAEMNAAAKAVPADERAWPFYRQALMALDLPAADKQWWTKTQVLPPPDAPAWQDLAAFVERNQQSLALARQGAARPALGFVFGDPEDREFLQKTVQRESILPSKDAFLFQLLLPHQQELRNLAGLLVADARRAQAAGDGTALVADLHCLLALASHQRTGNTLIEELISLATFGLALDVTADALAEQPQLFQDANLIGLAHAISAFWGGGTLRPRADGEQRMFDDLLQHGYTDNGQGDGYLTVEGLRLLRQLDGPTAGGQDASWLDSAVGPGMTVALAGRREMRELSLRLMAQMAAERAGPLYAWESSQVEAELQKLHGSLSTRLRYLPVLLLLPGIQAVATAGERRTQERDAVLTAIALELYHRRHAAWPDRLDVLAPNFLPEVPLDRFTGGPLAYRLVDGRPLLYARGMDRQDDGGRGPPDGTATDSTWWRAVMTKPAVDRPRGQGYDWVLWPRPHVAAPDPE